MLPQYSGGEDAGGGHQYTNSTWGKKLVADYTGLDFRQVEALDYGEYLLLRRDAFIHGLGQTVAGREYLENAWRMEQTEPDRAALRRRFGRKGAT